MSEREPRFKYRLDPLARLRAGVRDALKAEAAQAAREVELRAMEMERLGRELERVEGELRALRSRGGELAVDAELRAQGYLAAHRERLLGKRRELEAARGKADEARSRLQLKQRDARALERHRDRQRREYDIVRGRSATRAADEQWLLMLGRRRK